MQDSSISTGNPKDLIGNTKVSLSKLPFVAVLHGSHAMMDGAKKYGAFNFRESQVKASIYIDAAMRHLMAWFDGEEVAQDSKVHHLGHAIACCAILLDTQATKKLIDDRPKSEGLIVAKTLEQLSKQIKQEKEQELLKPFIFNPNAVYDYTAGIERVDGVTVDKAVKTQV